MRSDWFFDQIEAGVTYANRPQGATTGAWPGFQPFGGWKGSGASGKNAGGHYYLPLYMHEQIHTRQPTLAKIILSDGSAVAIAIQCIASNRIGTFFFVIGIVLVFLFIFSDVAGQPTFGYFFLRRAGACHRWASSCGGARPRRRPPNRRAALSHGQEILIATKRKETEKNNCL